MDTATQAMITAGIIQGSILLGYMVQGKIKARLTDVERVDLAHGLALDTLREAIKTQDGDIAELKQAVHDCEKERAILRNMRDALNATLIIHGIKPPLFGLNDIIESANSKLHKKSE